jgi:three-Cys-motif partner protein
MRDGDFFERQTRASQVKAEIVARYFWVWAKTATTTASEIGYVDLFAGPGRYGDGAKSTPLLILERAISDAKFARILHVVLNDRDQGSVDVLRRAVAQLPGIATLQHAPIIMCHEIDEAVIQWIATKWLYPSLVFLDPWGSKGLSLRLIHAALSRQLTEVIFFFNYDRVDAAIPKEFMKGDVAALFAAERAQALRREVQAMAPEERERRVLEALRNEVTVNGRYHWKDFRFTSSDVDKISHYLILATKHPAGLKRMQEIMGDVPTVIPA